MEGGTEAVQQGGGTQGGSSLCRGAVPRKGPRPFCPQTPLLSLMSSPSCVQEMVKLADLRCPLPAH